MRIWCSCGAAIRARRQDALAWEQRHTCPDKPEQDGDLHVSTGAQVENAYQHDPYAQIRIGFTKE